MTQSRVVLYLLRRELRLSDNPIFHHLANPDANHGFSHLLPVYVFPAKQIDLSGFVPEGGENPYPVPKSAVGGYARCGPYRAKFLAESVWDLKTSLQSTGSDLLVRVGAYKDVLKSLVEGLKTKDCQVGAVWMTSHEGSEEKSDEKAVASFCTNNGIDFKLWDDEKYFINDRDTGITDLNDLPDVFTTYRKQIEPLREKARSALPVPAKGALPAYPDPGMIPSQHSPFRIPDTCEALVEAVVKPVKNFMKDRPDFPEKAESSHPFRGGETSAHKRIDHLVMSGGMKSYKDTRNGLLGPEFSTKLSAYLAQGCITARQIHHALVVYEDGSDTKYQGADGFGDGDNQGTETVRIELLWRDYMRLCHQKYGDKLFRIEGFNGKHADYEGEDKNHGWKTADTSIALPGQEPTPEKISEILARFNAGTTGMGLIDASQRELMHTGYTSNRARQNVASFLAKHMEIDWRYGAEWYEMLLVDYDVSSNWANWQYVAGVGNDPRGAARIFNPVKQAFDYDKEGAYVRAWVPEVACFENLENVFQAWTASKEDLQTAGLEDNIMVTYPVKPIKFNLDHKPSKVKKRPFFRKRGPKHRDQGSAESPGSSEGHSGSGSSPDRTTDASNGQAESSGAAGGTDQTQQTSQGSSRSQSSSNNHNGRSHSHHHNHHHNNHYSHRGNDYFRGGRGGRGGSGGNGYSSQGGYYGIANGSGYRGGNGGRGRGGSGPGFRGRYAPMNGGPGSGGHHHHHTSSTHHHHHHHHPAAAEQQVQASQVQIDA
ncbi:cryptochrome [Sordaria brevicollis]|uniref:Cryptochrome DASH n=1 Tax=Sordaria brevicollis TaxID=83679 RepID=A0AAE0P904_SORBR|nr:cryptochrome [Sordaria brevicollis]